MEERRGFMIKKLINKVTKGGTSVLLFYVTFNLEAYKTNGAKGSCELKLHPNITDDKAKRLMEELVNHIRENYHSYNFS